ncbi:hypothetical protein [Sneathia sanguinegens]|uniref:hypothetical protein n=1 Tax=Sneathia sanguinegens TaxID=40543 RepID=UPI00288A6BA7|nr:hypothetical protein [Sneathia sanguinegens]
MKYNYFDINGNIYRRIANQLYSLAYVFKNNKWQEDDDTYFAAHFEDRYTFVILTQQEAKMRLGEYYE